MTIAASDIFKCIDPIIRAVAIIPRTVLLPGARMALAGHVFDQADTFVRSVARGLDQDPALFGDIPIEGANLVGQQDRALGYLTLHSMLSALTARVADCYLAEQAGAVKDAMAVVRQVRSEGDQPFVRPDHEERRQAMLSAEDVLKRRQARKRRVRRDSLAKEARLPPSPPLGPLAASDQAIADRPPRKSPQEKAMSEMRNAQNDEMFDGLIANLASHVPTPVSPPSPGRGSPSGTSSPAAAPSPSPAASMPAAAAGSRATRPRADSRRANQAHDPGLAIPEQAATRSGGKHQSGDLGGLAPPRPARSGGRRVLFCRPVVGDSRCL